jgi:hypothetical protein
MSEDKPSYQCGSWRKQVENHTNVERPLVNIRLKRGEL